MLGLARLADRGPTTAAALAAVLLIAALWLPVVLPVGSFFAMFFIIASAAVVAFVLLRRGESAVVKTIGFCLVMLLVLSLVLYGSAIQAPLLAVVFWLPAILAAGVLGRTLNLGLTVLVILGCGVMTILALTFISGGDPQFWRTPLEQSLSLSLPNPDLAGDGVAGSLGQGAVDELSMLDPAQLDAIIGRLANMMTGAFGISVMTVALCALFLARFWHAALVNPGGFQKEFHALSLGRQASIGCLVMVVVALAIGGSLAISLLMVTLFAFFVQGLAVVHCVIKQRAISQGWLVGLYCLLLFLFPYMALLLAALGLADNLHKLRAA